MHQDAQLTYSQDQALTATAASTNSIDHGPTRNFGIGTLMFLVVTLTVAMTDSGSDSTITVTLETDDNAAFSSATVRRTIGVFAAASAAGTKLIVPIGPGDIPERYSQLRFTAANGNLTTGSVTAFLSRSHGENIQYAEAIHVG